MKVLQTLTYNRRWTVASQTPYSCVDFSTNGRFIAYGSGGDITIAATSNGDQQAIIQNPDAKVVALKWSGPNFAVGAFDNGTIVDFVFQNDSLDVTGVIARDHTISCLAVGLQTTHLATGTGPDIRIWTRSRDQNWGFVKRLSSPRTLQDNLHAAVVITSMHFRPQKKPCLIVSYKNHGVQIWDVTSASVIASVLNTSTALGHSSLSPDYQHLAIVMRTGIDIHQVVERLPSTPLDSNAGLQGHVSFVHGGDAILGSYDIGKVRLWRRLTGTRLQTLIHPVEEHIIALADYHSHKEYIYRVATLSSSTIAVWEAVMPGRVPRRHSNFGGWLMITVVFVIAVLYHWMVGSTDMKDVYNLSLSYVI